MPKQQTERGKTIRGEQRSKVSIGQHFQISIRISILNQGYFLNISPGAEGLGFTVVTRDSSVHGPGPILVKNILQRGAAVKDGRLQPGDRILEVKQTFWNTSAGGTTSLHFQEEVV